MERSIVIESECAVTNLDFPLHLDHAWLFIAAGIHLRLFKRTSENEYIPEVVQEIKQIELRKYLLIIGNANFWSDKNPIVVEEVANALSRGRRAGIFSSVRIVGIKHIEVVVRNRIALDMELLASPLFTVTPSCRKERQSIATCGPYVLNSASADGRLMTFRLRDEFEGPETITIVATKDREQGLKLIGENQITFSCPLGANPSIFSDFRKINKVTNRLTNLGLILRPYPDCSLAKDKDALTQISDSIQRQDLADATLNTFVPLINFSALFSPPEKSYSKYITGHRNNHSKPYSGPISMELRYVDFEPNHQIAAEIAKQLYQKHKILCLPAIASYPDYVASRYPQKMGISLEIIQPFLPEKICRMKWEFLDLHRKDHGGLQNRTLAIPLLQSASTLISLKSRYKGIPLLTKEAIFDWRDL